MPINLPDLPYDYSDLEPHISRRTMILHHTKHHANYVNNVNKLVVDTSFDHMALEDIIVNSDQKSELFNNSAQVYNHNFFWRSMKPQGGGMPEGKILTQINKNFVSFANFIELFKDSILKQFGSGWGWLIWNRQEKKLTIETTSNAITPIVNNDKLPILAVDVWEHAYYLDYTSQRKQFLDVFMDHLVNWQFANENFITGNTLIDLRNINVGQSRTMMWKGVPIFIRRRTQEEIRLAHEFDLSKLQYPEADSARVKNAEWLILIGSCTDLGCSPMVNASGWFCPCHSTQYDLSGRVINDSTRKNMKVPSYKFIDNNTIALDT